MDMRQGKEGQLGLHPINDPERDWQGGLHHIALVGGEEVEIFFCVI